MISRSAFGENWGKKWDEKNLHCHFSLSVLSLRQSWKLNTIVRPGEHLSVNRTQELTILAANVTLLYLTTSTLAFGYRFALLHRSRVFDGGSVGSGIASILLDIRTNVLVWRKLRLKKGLRRVG